MKVVYDFPGIECLNSFKPCTNKNDKATETTNDDVGGCVIPTIINAKKN